MIPCGLGPVSTGVDLPRRTDGLLRELVFLWSPPPPVLLPMITGKVTTHTPENVTRDDEGFLPFPFQGFRYHSGCLKYSR